MTRKLLTLSAVLSIMFVGCFTGCNPETTMTLKFNQDDTSVYKVSQTTSKEVSFEQPSLNKSKVDVVSTTVDVTFSQKIEDVRENGDALVNVTIDAIKFYSKGKKGVNLDFDSTRAADKNKPLAKLIGQSYKIKVDPLGDVEVVDVAKARAAAVTREAKSLLKNDLIIARHQILAMPETEDVTVAKGKSWSKVVSSPKGALEAKAFEKVYTVDGFKKQGESNVAVISMNANPTDKKPEGGLKGSGGLGVMAGIFDSSEDYTGKLVFDTTTGKIVNYNEQLKAEYVAAEEPKGGQVDKGPDVLTMTFISSFSVEQIK